MKIEKLETKLKKAAMALKPAVSLGITDVEDKPGIARVYYQIEAKGKLISYIFVDIPLEEVQAVFEKKIPYAERQADI